MRDRIHKNPTGAPTASPTPTWDTRHFASTITEGSTHDGHEEGAQKGVTTPFHHSKGQRSAFDLPFKGRPGFNGQHIEQQKTQMYSHYAGNGDWYKNSGHTKVNGVAKARTATPTAAPTRQFVNNFGARGCKVGSVTVPVHWQGACSGANYCKMCTCNAKCITRNAFGHCTRYGQTSLTMNKKGKTCGAPSMVGGHKCRATYCSFAPANSHKKNKKATSQKVIFVHHKFRTRCNTEAFCEQKFEDHRHKCAATKAGKCSCMCKNGSRHVWRSYQTYARHTSKGKDTQPRHSTYRKV